jgi:lysozyme family protein
MSNFNQVAQWLLWIEDDKKVPGKIVNLGDGGGMTRLGITSANWTRQVPSNFFTDLAFGPAITAAKLVARTFFWNRFSGDQILSDAVAAPLLSFAFNYNVPTAVKTLQKAASVQPDGAMGPLTLHAINAINPAELAANFRTGWAQFYRDDAAANPSKAKFLQGWLDRVNIPYPAPGMPCIYV